MVAVEKGAIKGVITERGSTRIIVVGDSYFLGNAQIDSAANRDFVGNAVNWLLERTQLLAGLGPRPISQYKIVMTRTQFHQAQWVLLAGLPGSVLFLGGLVWLRRRK
jgi:LPXTG-motif cell wall-anchored protein